jgi:hypothetical protein
MRIYPRSGFNARLPKPISRAYRVSIDTSALYSTLPPAQQKCGASSRSIYMNKGLFFSTGAYSVARCPRVPELPPRTTIVAMARTSKLQAQTSSDEHRTWAARADARSIPLSTFYHQQHGRPSIKEKAQGQQYLSVEEEKALVAFLLMMSSFGQPVRIKYIPSLACNIACRRSSRSVKPPGKNWARAFEKQHPELKAQRVRSIDWKRHEIHIHDKVIG